VRLEPAVLNPFGLSRDLAFIVTIDGVEPPKRPCGVVFSASLVGSPGKPSAPGLERA